MCFCITMQKAWLLWCIIFPLSSFIFESHPISHLLIFFCGIHFYPFIPPSFCVADLNPLLFKGSLWARQTLCGSLLTTAVLSCPSVLTDDEKKKNRMAWRGDWVRKM